MFLAALDSNGKMALAALVIAVIALLFSLVANFPGLKGAAVVFRDAVLWLAMCLVLGGGSLFVWKQFAHEAPASASNPATLPTYLPTKNEHHDPRAAVLQRHTTTSNYAKVE